MATEIVQDKVEAEARVNSIVRPGIDSETVMNMYDRWAATYDEDLTQLLHYNPPIIGAQETARIFADKKDAHILDVAAGTGLVGVHLSRKGFTNLDALDASAAMLEEARKKNVYKKLIEDFLGPNKLDIPDNTYDGVVGVGCFCQGHVQATCFDELIRIVKPGGWIIVAMRECYLHEVPHLRAELEPTMKRHEKEGKWKWVERRNVKNYHEDYPGLLYTFHIC